MTVDPLVLSSRLCYDMTVAVGPGVAAVVLHGSAVLGDFFPEHSDLDLLVVVHRSLSDEECEAAVDVVAGHGREADVNLDVRFVTETVARSPTFPPDLDVGIEFRAREPGRPRLGRHVAEADLVIELSMCRLHGRSLYGTAPHDVIGLVPSSWVVAVGDAQLADWQRIGFEATYGELMVFTACRLWRFHHKADHAAKSEAARWVLDRRPDLDVVRAALARRGGDSAELDGAQVMDLLDLVRAEISEVIAN